MALLSIRIFHQQNNSYILADQPPALHMIQANCWHHLRGGEVRSKSSHAAKWYSGDWMSEGPELVPRPFSCQEPCTAH